MLRECFPKSIRKHEVRSIVLAFLFVFSTESPGFSVVAVVGAACGRQQWCTSPLSSVEKSSCCKHVKTCAFSCPACVVYYSGSIQLWHGIHYSQKLWFHLVIHSINLQSGWIYLVYAACAIRKKCWRVLARLMGVHQKYPSFISLLCLVARRPTSSNLICNCLGFQRRRHIEKLLKKIHILVYNCQCKNHKVYGVGLWWRKDVLQCFVDSKMSIWEEHYVCFADWGGFHLFHCPLHPVFITKQHMETTDK